LLKPAAEPALKKPMVGSFCGLLRTRRERSRDCGAAEQRDELAGLQLIELHSIPASRGRIAGYRIGHGQSAGISVSQYPTVEEPVRSPSRVNSADSSCPLRKFNNDSIKFRLH
jgi:hypothetical protein